MGPLSYFHHFALYIHFCSAYHFGGAYNLNAVTDATKQKRLRQVQDLADRPSTPKHIAHVDAMCSGTVTTN